MTKKMLEYNEGSLLFKVDQNRIAIMTYNRPEAMNSMDMEALDRQEEIISGLLHDRELRDHVLVLIIGSTGYKAFSVGGDLKGWQETTADDRIEQTYNIQDKFRDIESLPMPTIAAIKGFCLGGGLETALRCDLRVVAEDAELGVPEIRWGGFPGAGGAVLLPKLCTVGKAKEMLFTGRRISGKEAYNFGLCERCVPKERVDDEAYSLAMEIVANAPLATRAVKKLVNYGFQTTTDVAFALNNSLREQLQRSEDQQEGLTAFKEKRKPVFKGR